MKTLTKDALIVTPRQELIDSVLTLQSQVEELNFKIEWFKRQIFGTKSERFVPSDDLQAALELDIIKKEDVENVAETKTVTYNRKGSSSSAEPKPGHGRGNMPTHLPIEDKTIEPEGDLTGMIRIGEEVSWYFEMLQPASLRIIRTTRPKYVFPKECGVLIGNLPALPVEKGNAGPGLITQIIIDKFVYHMPLDRQRKKFKNEYNVDFAESFLSNTVKNGTFWLESVYNANIEKLLTSSYLQGDETPIQVTTKDKNGKTHRGYFWVYHDPIRKLIIFDYRPNRTREGPSDFLKNFKGVLQIDGYEGYREIINRNGLTHAACMDHVRRRFENALGADKERATYALDAMRSWYDVEREAREKGLSLEERFAMRVEKTNPSMNAFKDWMLKEISQVLPKSLIGNAFSYALNQWPYFTPFMTDARIELSNILIENAIRPVALGRKNFLFAGSHDAAKWAAIIYSLVSTAKWHGYDPFVYIKELLTKLPESTTSDIEKYLLPGWKPQESQKHL